MHPSNPPPFSTRYGRGSTRDYIITIYNKQVYEKIRIITIAMIYDFITNMYFTGMTHGGMIHLSRAKEPEVFRGFWLLFLH